MLCTSYKNSAAVSFMYKLILVILHLLIAMTVFKAFIVPCFPFSFAMNISSPTFGWLFAVHVCILRAGALTQIINSTAHQS